MNHLFNKFKNTSNKTEYKKGKKKIVKNKAWGW